MNTFCIEFLSNLEDDPHKRKKHSNKCAWQRVFEKCLPQKKCVWQSVFQQCHKNTFQNFIQLFKKMHSSQQMKRSRLAIWSNQSTNN